MFLARKIAGTVIAVSLFAAPAMAKAAPGFVLKDLHGIQVTLAQFKGKIVFLDFWASWCPPCRRSIPAVEKLYEKLNGQDVVVLGINIEGDANTARKFVASQGVKYTVLVGDENVARDYRVNGIPAFFIIDRDGSVTKQFSGYQPGMETEWENIITGMQQSAPDKAPQRAPSTNNKQPVKK